MKSVNYPIAWPVDFLSEVKQAAKDAGISTAATIRRSTKLGLPKFRQETAGGRVTNVDPLPEKVARALYSKRDDDEAVTQIFMAAQFKGARE